MSDADPYILPDGNVQISFSGGRTSAYMLHQILEANGGLPDRARVVFTNTGREMPETLEFVRECGDQWGVPITWLEWRPDPPLFEEVSFETADRDGRVFEELITKNSMLPNVAVRFCTKELKILTARRYLISIGWEKWTNALGIRADEGRRVRPSNDSRVVRWFPLVSASVRKIDVNGFWSNHSFDLRLTTTGNCDGCFLKGEANRAAMWRSHPDRMQWWSDQEQRIGQTFVKDQSYSELGEFVDRQGDWIFETDGVLCQADDGECTG